MKSAMVAIKLPVNLTDQQFQKLSHEWDRAREAEIILPRKMNDSERDALIRFLLSKIPSDLALGALCDLAEWPGVPAELLTRLFDHGDTGCNVAVCLRDELSPALQERCRNSPDTEVREHFLARQAVLDQRKR
jgi:hypothetical protein